MAVNRCTFGERAREAIQSYRCDFGNASKSLGYRMKNLISYGGAFIHAALALVIAAVGARFQNWIMRLL